MSWFVSQFSNARKYSLRSASEWWLVDNRGLAGNNLKQGVLFCRCRPRKDECFQIWGENKQQLWWSQLQWNFESRLEVHPSPLRHLAAKPRLRHARQHNRAFWKSQVVLLPLSESDRRCFWWAASGIEESVVCPEELFAQKREASLRKHLWNFGSRRVSANRRCTE